MKLLFLILILAFWQIVPLFAADSTARVDPAHCTDSCPNPLNSIEKLSQTLKSALRLSPRDQITARCPEFRFEKEYYKFSDAIKSAETIDGENFPRNDKILYRGMERNSPQIDISSSVSSLLGDSTHFVGGLQFSELRNILLGQVTLNTAKHLAEYKEHGWQSTKSTDFYPLLTRLLSADPLTKEKLQCLRLIFWKKALST